MKRIVALALSLCAFLPALDWEARVVDHMNVTLSAAFAVAPTTGSDAPPSIRTELERPARAVLAAVASLAPHAA
jgi:hypothetical protein